MVFACFLLKEINKVNASNAHTPPFMNGDTHDFFLRIVPCQRWLGAANEIHFARLL